MTRVTFGAERGAFGISATACPGRFVLSIPDDSHSTVPAGARAFIAQFDGAISAVAGSRRPKSTSSCEIPGFTHSATIASVAQRINQQGEGWRGLAAAGIVEMVT